MNKLSKVMIVLLLALGLSACGDKKTDDTVEVKPSSDTISSASKVYFYEATAFEQGSAEFNEMMKSPSTYGAVSIATTNKDGSPNSATVIPGMVDAENEILIMGFGTEGSTKQNLLERKLGVVTIYKQDPTAEDKTQRNLGARVIVEAVEDQSAAFDELVSKGLAEAKSKETTVVLKVVRVLPLG